MELSPQSVSATTFKIVKKGYDPDEVRAYLGQLATSIESIQTHTSAMEARARAAVARLQEIAAQTPSQPATPDYVAPSAEESETISRTLLLAQRTADQTIADAENRAKAISEAADSDARSAVESAQEAASRMVEDAKVEARKAGEGQRLAVESEVQALLARREFLLSDVDHLEQHMVTQRERLQDVAVQLTTIAERAPGGLADIRRPLVSAVESDETTNAGTTNDGPGADDSATDVTADDLTSDDVAPDDFGDAPMVGLDEGIDEAAPPAADIAEGSGPFDETVPIANVDASSIAESGFDEHALAPPEIGTAVGSVADRADDTNEIEVAGDIADAAPSADDANESAEQLDPIWSSDDATPPAGTPKQFDFDQVTSDLPSSGPDTARD